MELMDEWIKEKVSGVEISDWMYKWKREWRENDNGWISETVERDELDELMNTRVSGWFNGIFHLFI